MTAPFAITFDYLCPFARNANESIVDGLRDGADWDVTFRPFSLAQTKVEADQPDVWERESGSDGTRGVLALQWGIAVRDNWSEQFLQFHTELFEARHGRGADIGDESELHAVAAAANLAPTEIAAEVASGRPQGVLAAEHQEAVHKWEVFGVPTFVVGDEAVFVRCMERHQPDEIEQIVQLIEWTNLNEFKRTKVPR
ncbi:MAG: DsbA family protein [Acidimicrobiia bacterium]|nr:DsbA family protein [Acidimicrobiia bacterium]MDX2468708.1 DsbA family protein [Acidimicrobiia bacterium]